ncbi:MAG: hypothetical protein AB8B74_02355 [Crocinitomicaceae bacterium]
MKYKLSILTFSILLGVACQKEVQPLIKQEAPVANESQITQKAQYAGLILWELYDSGGTDGGSCYYECTGSPGNCGVTISVCGASNSDIINDIYIAIDANDNAEVANLFSIYETELITLFNEDVVNGVIDATLTLEKGNGKTGDPAIYVLFKNQNNEIEFAQRIIN